MEAAGPTPIKIRQALTFGALLLFLVALGALFGTALVSPDWQIVITAVGLSTYVVVALVNPLAGLFLWVSTSPFSRFLYLNISLGRGIPDLSLDRIAAAVIFVLIFAQLAIRKRAFPRLTVVDLLLVMFLIGSSISIPLATAGPTATIQAYFDAQIAPMIVYFLAKNLVTNKRALRGFQVTLMLMAVYLAFLVIHEQLTGNILFYPVGRTVRYTAHIRRVVGLLGNPAFFAMVLGMILPFVARALAEARDKRSRLFYLILAAGVIWAIYLCYNRAGWLAALLALLFMSAFYPRFRRLFLPALLVAGVTIAIYWGEISQSYVVTERLTAEAPVDYRFNAIDIAFRMVSSNLTFGRGYGNFGYLYSKYASDWTQTRVLPAPHNTYINILVSAGLAGFVPYVATFVAIFAQGLLLWRRSRFHQAVDRTLLICMNGAVIVYASTIFFSDIVAVPYVTSVFFFIVGSVLGYTERVSRWGDPGEWLI